jgi:hypothetical protein
MKLTYARLKKQSSLMKSSTGLSMKEFEFLLPVFEKHWHRVMVGQTFEGKPRQRRRTGRVNSKFESVGDMLIFVLYDYRHNPTQELLALHFDLTQPKVALWLKNLEPILLMSLKEMKLVPVRASEAIDNLLIESVTVLLDGTERPVNRPKYDQVEFYSGKKRNTP